MKDLYRRLGVNRTATHAELEEALGQNRDMAAYATVLLNEQKRAVYDRAHSALTTIGVLRQRLGLDPDRSWFVDQYADFAPAALRKQPGSTGAPAEQPASRAATTPHPAPAPGARRVGRGSLIVLVLAAAALAAMLWFVLN